MPTHQTQSGRGLRAIRLAQVVAVTGVSRPTIWRWVRNDPTFPKPFHLSAGITAWDEAEITAWIEGKKSLRGAA